MLQWWSSPYFLLCIVAGLGVLGRELFRYRMARMLQRQQDLESAVQTRTRELEIERAALIAAREELTLRAMRDGLTGLWNRSAIFGILERELDRAKRGERPVALVLVDLDHFKSINDTYGHLTGDMVLVESALRLTSDLRIYDSTGRYGGEELLIVLANCDRESAVKRAEDLRERLRAEPVGSREERIHVTASFGVTVSTPGIEINQFVHEADLALYEAKRAGRDRVVAAWDIANSLPSPE